MKYIKIFEEINIEEETVTLYHGTCENYEEVLLKNGYSPRKPNLSGKMVWYGGQGGQPQYLYLSLTPESANWYACKKGNDGSVIEISNIPKSYLKVDPEDGMYNTVDEELERGNSLILCKPLSPNNFKRWGGKLTITGCGDDY